MLLLRAAQLAAACARRLAAWAALPAKPPGPDLLPPVEFPAPTAAGCSSPTRGEPQVGVGMKVERSSPGAPDCFSLSTALVRRRFRLGGTTGCRNARQASKGTGEDAGALCGLGT